LANKIIGQCRYNGCFNSCHNLTPVNPLTLSISQKAGFSTTQKAGFSTTQKAGFFKKPAF
jgi:hypothetical protein